MKLKVAIRSPNWLGDAVMAFPAVRAIREAHPEAEITVLTRVYLGELWRLNPDVDSVCLLEKGILGELRESLKLKEKGFDILLIMPRSFLTALAGFLMGVPLRIGFNSEGRGIFLTKGVNVDRKKHRVLQYLDLLKPLDIPANTSFPLLTPPAIPLKLPQPAIAFNTGANYGEAKCWPKEKFAELGKLLAKDGFEILLLGTQKEMRRNREIAMRISHKVTNLTGKTSLSELATLLTKISCLVTNDTGTMHLASALGTPVVAIFGSTDPNITGPWGEKAKVIRHKFSCSPCFKRKCPEGHFGCLESISVEEVYCAVKELINGR